ncbi:DUF4326 domain-containing protein [Rhizobium leguminosarum]|uniref:DUF4326 domain-containing protein n=1 Tax=Rhizobium leguminosarum TaxID=384 RepID=UPI001C979960|nr:DUF4326 domain-containing protein [Rhizobium leguminosarum]MBY5760212.1 DUF4326 domain-containing protein [Rhizobium leguminosarum]
MARVLNARFLGRQNGPKQRYIGRPDILGNPFVIGRDGTRAEVIAKYRRWAPKQPHIMAALPQLIGKDLICWCAPLPCHGDVLMDMVRQYVCDEA